MDCEPTSPSSPSSPKQMIRSSTVFSCCFGLAGGVIDDERPVRSSSSTWLRSWAKELPEVKGCLSLVSRVGKQRRRHHPGGGFRYDPLSYALNFDDGAAADDDDYLAGDGFRYRNFSSRLPATPAGRWDRVQLATV